MRRLHLFILLFAASSLLFQFPPDAFAATPSDISAIDSMDDSDGSLELNGASDVDTFTIGSSTYAIVTSFNYDGVQIIDISDPTNIVAKDTVRDTAAGRVTEFDELNGATDVETFTIGSSTYAIVASQDDDGVQIIDISDVDNLVAKGSMDDTDSVSYTHLTLPTNREV